MPGDSEDLEWVENLADAGWEQGSIFLPSPEISEIVPEFISIEQGQVLVICTQTCSLLSKSLEKEPVVEVLVADLLDVYDPNAPRAKGKENNNFHLSFVEGDNIDGRYPAINCCISKRLFFPRQLLSTSSPINVDITSGSLKAFKGWIANYYIRVALPDSLVSRMKLGKKKSFKESISKVLKENFENDYPFHKGVRTFYISWSPNNEEEIIGNPYKIKIVIVCDNQNIEDDLQERLENKLHEYNDENKPKNGIILSELIVRYMDNISLLDIDGMFRFNGWDDLSSLDERTEGYRLD